MKPAILAAMLLLVVQPLATRFAHASSSRLATLVYDSPDLAIAACIDAHSSSDQRSGPRIGSRPPEGGRPSLGFFLRMSEAPERASRVAAHSKCEFTAATKNPSEGIGCDSRGINRGLVQTTGSGRCDLYVQPVHWTARRGLLQPRGTRFHVGLLHEGGEDPLRFGAVRGTDFPLKAGSDDVTAVREGSEVNGGVTHRGFGRVDEVDFASSGLNHLSSLSCYVLRTPVLYRFGYIPQVAIA
jgi:hypothetical protein